MLPPKKHTENRCKNGYTQMTVKLNRERNRMVGGPKNSCVNEFHQEMFSKTGSRKISPRKRDAFGKSRLFLRGISC